MDFTPKLDLVILDCPDALHLAKFYSDLLGWPLEDGSDGAFATLVPPGGGVTPDNPEGRTTLAFQRIDDWLVPTWPGGASSAVPPRFQCGRHRRRRAARACHRWARTCASAVRRWRVPGVPRSGRASVLPDSLSTCADPAVVHTSAVPRVHPSQQRCDTGSRWTRRATAVARHCTDPLPAGKSGSGVRARHGPGSLSVRTDGRTPQGRRRPRAERGPAARPGSARRRHRGTSRRWWAHPSPASSTARRP